MAATNDKQDWRFRLHEIIFESNTFAGKAFDVGLFITIFTIMIIVMQDSVHSLHIQYGNLCSTLE